MELSKRQEAILEIVKKEGPITGEQIAERLSLTRATLRPDMAILTMAGLLEARPRVGYYYSGKTPNKVIAEKLHRIKVGEVKSVPVVVSEHCSVYDAVVTMFIEDVGTLIVVREGGILEGVISRKDLLKITLGGQDIHKLPVGVVMTRMPNVITVGPDDSVWLAAKKLITHEVDALPVVRPVEGGDKNKDLEVIGRLSKTNITRLFVELGEGN
ncbi:MULTISPECIES: helix-turn-helix transcriptional regulator [Desulfofundulus]|uniref:Transcriptional regulator n=3 Tax=Desulfofundulus TaxID=2282741 RepID=A0A494X0B2_9FIRM|nr:MULTISPECIES: helix-turn-helix transcriptional regulator [Desulfofundulus]AEG16141.1 transcriptional regulator [Desulfofundulus kuznetsovii DSM 6115]RKO66254.1 transcriptional regulator [Desulfofundulus salinum]SHI31822.1 CBS domain-containing protein [Desulfofundulus thermosubterraneus DSM 16057]